MISTVRAKILDSLFLQKLKKSHCCIHKSITLRDRDYIKIGKKVCIGEGSRLLCWSKYTSGKRPQL